MRSITHAQAFRYLQNATDHLLAENEQAVLTHHLQTCTTCRAEAERLTLLEADLRQTFHDRWDVMKAPSIPLVTSLPAAPGWVTRFSNVGINIALAIVWLWLYRAMLSYLRIIFTHQEFRTNQIMLLGVGILIISQLRQERLHLHLDASPHIYLPGLALALGSSGLYLLSERFLDINTLSATLFGLATYGLLGLWISPRNWNKGLPAALLLVGTLPFGQHLETFVGYPLRRATAEIVSHGLNSLGITSVNVDTILVLESGFSQVDSPCSGVKSLWTGLLFLLAATWLERHSVNLRWLGVAILTGGLLVIANIIRISILVLVGQVAKWPVAAEMIHVPLGVLGFVAVCSLAAFLLMVGRQDHLFPALQTSPNRSKWRSGINVTLTDPRGLKRPAWFAPILVVIVLGMGLIYSPRPESAHAQSAISWIFPTGLAVEPFPLSRGLYVWATEDGADTVERWRFSWGDLHGSMLFLTSRTWRGQHRPERCFEVEGLSVETAQTYLISPDFAIRFLTLTGGPYQVSAAYWLQTKGQVTNDYATRIWADLSPQRQPWVLVTILFEGTPAPDSPAVQALFQALRTTIADGLEGELP
jgi:exosortase O